jgi:CheY-like chemotaxis protein/HPt (histidine-containing phosphotransfer) domain-containing protein
LQGEIHVRSELGKGSVFTLAISTGPLADVALRALPAGEACGHAETPAEANAAVLHGAKILVVEDGPTNRKLFRVVLGQAGAEVSTAENGLVAVELAHSYSYDAILMDVQMPVMDGFTATRQLRDMGIGVPILALTAHAMKGDEAKCREAGCSGYLTKPISPEQLLQGVAAAMTASLSTVIRSRTEVKSVRLPRQGGRLVSKLPMNQPVFREVVAEFAQFAGQQVESMRRALAERDFTRLARLAHALKGTGGTAGFDEFTDPSREIERLARDSDEASLQRLLDQVAELSRSICVPDGAVAVENGNGGV